MISDGLIADVLRVFERHGVKLDRDQQYTLRVELRRIAEGRSHCGTQREMFGPICTASFGHDGDHVAHDPENTILTTWPRAEGRSVGLGVRSCVAQSELGDVCSLAHGHSGEHTDTHRRASWTKPDDVRFWTGSKTEGRCRLVPGCMMPAPHAPAAHFDEHGNEIPEGRSDEAIGRSIQQATIAVAPEHADRSLWCCGVDHRDAQGLGRHMREAHLNAEEGPNGLLYRKPEGRS